MNHTVDWLQDAGWMVVLDRGIYGRYCGFWSQSAIAGWKSWRVRFLAQRAVVAPLEDVHSGARTGRRLRDAPKYIAIGNSCMPTFTTVFRASVMLIATIIVVKGWQIYGPSTTWLKTVAARALELAQDSLAEPRSVEKTGLAVVAAENAPAFSATPPSLEAVGPTIAAPPVFPTGDGEAVPAVLPQPVSMAAPVMDPSDGRSSVSESAVDRMPLLMNRLSKLGAVNSQLAPWGSSGQLYRFCCSAAVAKAPNLLRHFESVAVEPLAAVEEVLAKVEAWRTAEEGGNQLK